MNFSTGATSATLKLNGFTASGSATAAYGFKASGNTITFLGANGAPAGTIALVGATASGSLSTSAGITNFFVSSNQITFIGKNGEEGTLYLFSGAVPALQNCTSSVCVPQATVRWGISLVVDTDSNEVATTWTADGGDAYPSRVTYGPVLVHYNWQVRAGPEVLRGRAGSLPRAR